MSRAPALTFRSVRAGYRNGLGWLEALRDLELEAPARRITVLVGPNGAGKTTVFRLVLGFMTPTAGEITIDGTDPRRYRSRAGVGYVPEGRVLPPHWTPLELLRRGASLCLPPSRRKGAVEAARAMTELPDEVLRRPGGTLSKGMARRVTLAWALLGGPKLVLLDEPMSGLDAAARRCLREAIVRARDEGATVVLASHDLAEVEALADQVAILAGGTVSRILPSPGHISAAAMEAAVLDQEGVV